MQMQGRYLNSFLKKWKCPIIGLPVLLSELYSTAIIFANAFKYDAEKLVIKKKVYEASIKNLKLIVNQIPDNVNAILFGHNPGLTNFFNEVSDSYADNIPTCGVLQLSRKANVNKWKDVFNKKMENDFTAYPKEFK